MTKKHFIALADMIKAQNDIIQGHTSTKFNYKQVEVLADFCAYQNPRFNRERWIAYINGECGKNGGKVKQAVKV